jgi:hypothetical protein
MNCGHGPKNATRDNESPSQVLNNISQKDHQRGTSMIARSWPLTHARTPRDIAFDATNTHTTCQPESGAVTVRFLVRQHERRRRTALAAARGQRE